MDKNVSRRRFLQASGLAAGILASGAGVPRVHAAENSMIKIAWVGCGNRGGGAVRQALAAEPNAKLWAVADAVEDKAKGAIEALEATHEDRLSEGIEDRTFYGLEAYKQAIDSLDDGDVVLLTTPPAFRPLHYEYVVNSPKMIHVFAEKPVATDMVNLRRIRAANEKALAKGIKVGVGLNNRNKFRYEETIKAIHDGVLGEVVNCWVYRFQGPHNLGPKGNYTPLQHQLRNLFCFDWTSGGFIVDALIHNLDIACWAAQEYPACAQGSGGRTHRPDKDQLIDLASVEYVFPSGKRLMMTIRTMPNTWSNFCCVVQGTKGVAHVGEGVGDPKIYKGYEALSFSGFRGDALWKPSSPDNDSYQTEHDRLFSAIREDRPWNEMDRGIMATFTALLGRFTVETGQFITAEQAWKSEFRYDSEIAYDNLVDINGPSVVMPDENGDYYIPHPGVTKFV
ncbi:MAG: Gfo/Idh/MocA family oxidoreductase [Thermoguttaceae bacterium]|nr:Gfo/Idh/MocA family oxidoreductase [Thermoguttaceae bacterium]